jgi:hypothetical protein
MPVVFNKLATACPPLVVPTTVFTPDVVTFPTDGTQPVGPPWSTSPVVARTLPPVWVPVVNTAIAQADLGGRLGTIGGYGIEFGLQMLDLDSFGLPVTQGVASLDKPVMMPRLSNTDPTVPVGNPNDIAAHVPMVDNQDNYTWLLLGGVLSTVLGSTTPPTGVVAYVGLAHMALGVLTRDGSGVLYRIPGGLWQRKTADTGMPGDTPPATISFINYSLGDNSRWLWDGTAYIQQASSTISINDLSPYATTLMLMGG